VTDTLWLWVGFNAFILAMLALDWGILGALILRASMIAAGAALLAKFAWIIYDWPRLNERDHH